MNTNMLIALIGVGICCVALFLAWPRKKDEDEE